jgi:predicted aspartyl protease
MTSLADGLPPDVAARLSPEWRANEAGYWAARPELLAAHRGDWVAFADGAVVAAGRSAVEVLHAVADRPARPFVARVGAEDEPCRMRRAAFGYDTAYPGEPLPQLSAEFRAASGQPGVALGRVIPDTGADATALPWADCQALGFDPAVGQPARIGGVGGSSSATLVFAAWVVLDGREYRCRLQADFGGDERILGRDVLNGLEILFRGPAGEVVVNP